MYLGPEETVTLLFHVVINDPSDFLLPDLQTVDVDVILDVFEGTDEAVHSGSQ